MSVVIAAPQAKLPASSTATSAVTTDETPGTIDFAGLLFEQLAAGTNLSPDIANTPPLPLDDVKSVTTEIAPQDAAALLASLGIAPIQQPSSKDISINTSSAPPPEEGVLRALALKLAPSGQAQKAAEVQIPETKEQIFTIELASKAITAAPQNAVLNSIAASQEGQTGDFSDFILKAVSGVDGKAAKIAASDLSISKPEALAIPRLSDEMQPSGTANVSMHAQATALTNESTLKIEASVRDPSWTGEFTQKIVWLATNDKQVAQLSLNPPQMGPIEISLSLSKDSASAVFVSPNAEVREAIETALPRLREMLAGAGIELGQANVSAESFRQQAGNEDARQGAPRRMGDNDILGGDSVRRLSSHAPATLRGNGLVDIFA
jgi:flagellar hook-length control protein FliK